MWASLYRGCQRGASSPTGDPLLVCDSEGPRRNVTLSPAELLAALPCRVRDLVEIAAAVYVADLALRRDEGASWVREFTLEVAVADRKFWGDVQRVLESLIHLLLGDNVALRFVQRETPATPADPQQAPADVDCVSLLSGGVDSLGGAVALARTGRRPWLVSHSSRCPTTDEAQRRAHAAVSPVFSEPPDRLVTVLAPSRVRDPAQPFPEESQREPSQRGRSLFFLAAATAAAHVANVEEVFIAENGVIAMNLPLSPARLGSMSTRTTHPEALSLFAALASETLGRPLQVINPFQSMTKAEVIRDVMRPSLRADDIQATVSCWQAGRIPRQCGGCVPCLVRRISMLAAGLPDEAYMTDVLADPLAHQGTDALANLADLMMLAASFRDLNESELLIQHPELLDGANHGAPVEGVIDLYRRFAEEVFRVVPGFPKLAALAKPQPRTEVRG